MLKQAEELIHFFFKLNEKLRNFKFVLINLTSVGSDVQISIAMDEDSMSNEEGRTHYRGRALVAQAANTSEDLWATDSRYI